MPPDQLKVRYEVPTGKTAAELISEMTGERIGPIYLLLEFDAGDRELVILERVGLPRNEIDFERRGGEYVRQFSCDAVVAVTRVDQSQPLDPLG